MHDLTEFLIGEPHENRDFEISFGNCNLLGLTQYEVHVNTVLAKFEVGRICATERT
ncbi:MAG: hypothetical protein H7318_08475 [Oligoflexus sp.]|nr:hypothetical protein [Oligoflexus sp.]